MMKYLILFLITFPIVAVANNNTANQIQDNIIHERQQYLLKQKRDLEVKKLDNQEAWPELKKYVAKKDKSKCFVTKKILIAGNSLFKKELNQLAEDHYLNKCNQSSDITKILYEIKKYYVDRGYVIIDVRLNKKQTSLKKGRIAIQIAEGTIEDLVIKNYGNKKYSLLRVFNKEKTSFSFPYLKDKIVNLRDIEQGVEQINNLASNNAKIRIEPGDKIKSSKIIVNNETGKSANLSFSFDNNGSKATGKKRRNVSFSKDNLIGIDDYFSLSYIKDSESHSIDKYSKTISGSFSFPVGYWNFSFDAYRSSYLSSVRDINDVVVYYPGSTLSNNFSVKRAFFRNKLMSLSFENNLNLTDNKSYVESNDIKQVNNVGTKKITKVDFILTSNIQSNFGNIILKPSYSKGLDWFGALDDEHSGFNQQAQFEIYKFYANYSKYFSLPKLEIPLGFNFTFDGQDSKDILFGAQQKSIGGLYSIRGFKERGLQGDSGYSINNEVKLHLQHVTNKDFIRNWSIGLFYDYGMAKNFLDVKKNYLSGSGFNISYNHKHLNAKLTYAKPMHFPSGHMKEKNLLYFNIGTNLRLF